MKSKSFAIKSAVAALSLVAAFGLTACSGTESEPSLENPAGPNISNLSSASQGVIPGTENPDPSSEIPTSSADATSGNDIPQCEALTPECGYTGTELCTMGITEYCAAAPTGDESCTGATPVLFAQDVFNDIGDIYKNILCNEKVMFLVRHGERENFTGSASALTEDGFEAAIKAGQKMQGTVPFKYIYSGMERTKQTAMGFAAGRGEITYTTAYAEGADELEHFTVISPEFVADTMPGLRDGWFLKDKDARDANMKQDSITNVNVLYAAWAYDSKYADVFYDLDTRAQELVQKLVSDYASMPKYTLVASHDQVLMPLTVWATERKIDLRLHNEGMPRNWLNYLAGLAIIINDKNEIRYVPIKGMDDVVMPNGTIIDGGVQ